MAKRPQAKPIVLLVDDEPNVTDALKRTLRKEPYQILTATSAAAAIEVLGSERVDVIISDEQMPGMSGSEFLGYARRYYPRTIRIILSGQADLDSAVRAINVGEVHRFFLKPVNPIDLALTVRHALEHRRLEEQSRRLLRQFQKQASLLASLEGSLIQVERDELGAIVLEDDEHEQSVEELLGEIELAIGLAGGD